MPGMARLLLPPEMPRRVIDIIEIIGSLARTEILRLLARKPATTGELGEALETSRVTVYRHLVELEEHGLVVADLKPGERRGNKGVRWSVVPERVEQLGRQWIKYASGSDSETPADGRAKARGTGPS